MDSRLRTRIVNHHMSAANIDVMALCPDKDMEETVIIRVIYPPVDSVQGVSADEGYPKSLAGTDGRCAHKVSVVYGVL